MSDFHDDDEDHIDPRDEEVVEPPVEEPGPPAPVEPPEAKPTVEGRMTHEAMTWQEELVWALAEEESGRDLTDEEKAHIEQIKETAETHLAIAKAQREAANPPEVNPERREEDNVR